jgi:prolipoprotein diacylglyceryltransferase
MCATDAQHDPGLAGTQRTTRPRILFRIPINNWDIPVYTFGVILFLGCMTATWLGSRWARKRGISRESYQDAVLYLFLGVVAVLWIGWHFR